MVLSRVALDTGRRSTMAALANPQKLHGAVESCFPSGRERRLWRLDTLGGKLYLLILSENRPDLSALYRQFGGQEPPESRDYAPLLARIAAGSVWRFRLTANPTVFRYLPKTFTAISQKPPLISPPSSMTSSLQT